MTGNSVSLSKTVWQNRIEFSFILSVVNADDCVNWFQELTELSNERRIEEPAIIFDNASAHCIFETLSE